MKLREVAAAALACLAWAALLAFGWANVYVGGDPAPGGVWVIENRERAMVRRYLQDRSALIAQELEQCRGRRVQRWQSLTDLESLIRLLDAGEDALQGCRERRASNPPAERGVPRLDRSDPYLAW